MEQKIKKVNMTYLLLNIFGPIILAILVFLLAVVLPSELTGIMSTISALVFFGACIWWAIGISKLSDKKKEEKLNELDTTDFVRNNTFYGDGCTVAVDIEGGKIAMIFKWNPTECFVMPASRITRIWVDDGKTIGGTSRVSFLFVIDEVKVRVNTFISNRIWSMKSDNVVEAISKAEMMAEALQKAQASM